jgi:hypothetical protein
VIIPISYFSFYYQLDDTPEEWRDFYYSQFWKLRYPERSFFDRRNFSRIALYTPEKVSSFASASFHVNLAPNMKSNGFMLNDTAGNFRQLTDTAGKRRVALHDKIRKMERVPEVMTDLETLLDSLKERQIRFVLLTPPVWKTYSKFCDPKVLENNRRLINQVCARYGCSYFDYFNDSRFDKRDFANSDHLNFIGAEKFSSIIDSEIIKVKSIP